MAVEHEVKTLQETKTIFDELKTHPKSELFVIDELDTKQIKKLKKSLYTKENQFLKLIDLLENNIKINDDKIPIRLDYVEKDLRFIVSMVLFSSCTLTSPI